MPDNDKKRKHIFGKQMGKCEQEMQKRENKHAKQTKYAISTLSSSWGDPTTQ